jgi:7-cyano-7-deazaguanine synthase
MLSDFGSVKQKEEVVILYSGGADSTLLLEFARLTGKQPFCVLIDYGQLHIEELSFAEKQCKARGLSYKIIKLSGYDVASGLTTGDKGIYEGVHSHNVPARNSIFLSIAYGISESLGIQEIWYGADWSDFEHLFPDCTQEYIGSFNKMLEKAAVRPIKVYAPTLGLSKELVIHLLQSFGVNEKDIFSGYGEFA